MAWLLVEASSPGTEGIKPALWPSNGAGKREKYGGKTLVLPDGTTGGMGGTPVWKTHKHNTETHQ